MSKVLGDYVMIRPIEICRLESHIMCEVGRNEITQKEVVLGKCRVCTVLRYLQ